MQKVILKQNRTIQLPFDGTGKDSNEIARMIGESIMERCEEKIDFLFPVQWAMKAINLLHPHGGVLSILDKDFGNNANYKFTCFARNGEIGITATRCC